MPQNSDLNFYNRLELEQPVLLPEEVAALEQMQYRGWKSKVLDATWAANEGPKGLEAALERLTTEASAAIDAGFQFLIISDRAAGLHLLKGQNPNNPNSGHLSASFLVQSGLRTHPSQFLEASCTS